MNQIINMIIRQVMHQLVRRGINAGFDRMGRKGQPRGQAGLPPDALDDYGNPVQQHELTPDERRQRRHARQNARRAQQSMKAARRLNRF